MTFLTQFGSNQIISKKVKIFNFSVYLCVKLHSRTLVVQVGGSITFSRKYMASSKKFSGYLQAHRLTSESLSLIACSRKKKFNFYETPFFDDFATNFLISCLTDNRFQRKKFQLLVQGYGTHMRTFSLIPLLRLELLTTHKTQWDDRGP